MTNPNRYDEFAYLLELSTSQIVSYLHALLLRWDDVEDVFQDTCMVMWQKFDEFKSGTNFLAWSLRIAQLKAMNFQQKQARALAFTNRMQDALRTEFASREESPTTNLAALSACMDKLPPNDQRLIRLCYVEDLPVRQVAEGLGRSAESVHNSLLRIRTWLLKCIRRELKQAEMSDCVQHTPFSKRDVT